MLLAISAKGVVGQAQSVTSIFSPLATPAGREYNLSILVLVICGAIFAVVAGLLAFAVIRFRHRAHETQSEPAQVYGSNQIEIAWTVIPILIVVVLTMATARITTAIQNRAIPRDALKVTVIGHQYWWEFRYPDLGIVTANELHVPVSAPGQQRVTDLTLESADVVHSFWVPQLSGKTDLIPNRTNHMWIDPRESGIYLGNCAAYCGTQHANMQLRVVVDSVEEFDRWVAQQKQPAAEPAGDANVAAGRDVFMSKLCFACHTVAGTAAAGTVGPNLTHLMSRATLAARDTPLTAASLRAWVKDPHQLKPGNKMPGSDLTDSQLDQIAAYLATLK